MTHHNIINANNVIINYGKEQQDGLATEDTLQARQYLQSRGGVTDGNQVLSAVEDQGYYNTLGVDHDDEVMFIGRKVNTRAKQSRKGNTSMPNRVDYPTFKGGSKFRPNLTTGRQNVHMHKVPNPSFN